MNLLKRISCNELIRRQSLTFVSSKICNKTKVSTIARNFLSNKQLRNVPGNVPGNVQKLQQQQLKSISTKRNASSNNLIRTQNTTKISPSSWNKSTSAVSAKSNAASKQKSLSNLNDENDYYENDPTSSDDSDTMNTTAAINTSNEAIQPVLNETEAGLASVGALDICNGDNKGKKGKGKKGKNGERTGPCGGHQKMPSPDMFMDLPVEIDLKLNVKLQEYEVSAAKDRR